MEEEKKFTIYLHRCPNGKCYVGMTSLHPHKRWSNGFGYRRNYVFFEDIEYYGWDNIEHIILEEDLSREDACESEKYNIKKYNCIFPNGYNFAIGGDIPYMLGKHHTEDVKKKISKTLKGRIITESARTKIGNSHRGKNVSKYTRNLISKNAKNRLIDKTNHPRFGKYGAENPTSVPTNQYSLNGEFIKRWNSIKEAKDYYGNIDITKCHIGKYSQVGDYVWRKDGDSFDKYEVNRKNSAFPVIQYTIYGEYVKEYKNSSQASRETNINHNQILLTCKGILHQCNGKYTFRYKYDDFRKYPVVKDMRKMVILDGLVFLTMKSCYLYDNVGRGVLDSYLNGRCKMPQEYIERGLRYYNPETDKDLPIYVDTKNEV